MFSGKIVILLPSASYSWVLSIPQTLWIHKKVALRSFSVLWHNKVSLEYPKIPLIGIKLIVIRYFVEHNVVPLRKDSVLWEKKNWRKDVIASPSLIPNFFRYQKTSETKKDFSTEVFGTVRQKFLTENHGISILSEKTSLTETSDTLKVSSTNFAVTVRGKLLTENCDTTSLSPAPPPHLIQKISLNQKICETQKISPTMFFGFVIKQIFYRKSCFSTPIQKIFR